MKKSIKKGISFLVVIMMLISSMPAGVVAENQMPENSGVSSGGSQDLNQIEKVEVSEKTDGMNLDLEYLGFSYRNEKNGVVIISYNKELNKTKTLEIPETIDGTNVTKIDKEAFKDNVEIESVVIPKTVVEIDKTVLDGCSNLKTIVVNVDNPIFLDNDGVLYKKVSKEAFIKPEKWQASKMDNQEKTIEPQISTLEEPIKNTSQTLGTAELLTTNAIENGFEYIDIEGGVSIVKYSGSLGNVAIPSTLGGKKVIRIGDDAFSDNATLKTVSFNENVLSIGAGAFYNCNGLTQIELPSSLTTISSSTTTGYRGAFENCDNLSKMVIPQSVTTIGVNVFKNSTLVTIYGNNGSFAEGYANENNIPFVSLSLLIVNRFSTDKPSGQNINTNIKLTATGTKGTKPYQYKFFYELGGETVIIQNFANTNSISFIPIKAGMYKLYVQIKDASGKICTKSIEKYEIVDNPIVKSFTMDKESGQYVNTDVILTAVGTGGTIPYQYKFYYQLGTTTKTIHDFSTTNTATFKPTLAGTYTLYVDIKDKNGLVSTKNITGFKVVNNLSIKSFTADKASGQNINTSIQLKAKGAGGKTDYQYKFYYKLGTTIVTIQDFSATDTAIFKPSVAGTYTLCVDLKNESGNIITKSLSNFKVVDNPIIKSFTADKPSGQYVNTSVNLISEVTGGKTPYQYRYYYKLGEKTITIKNYSTVNTAIFKPTLQGRYTLCVDVKDASGKVATSQILNFNVVDNVSTKSFRADKSSGQNINTEIKLSASGTGGTVPYQYMFYYKLGTSTVILKNFSMTNNAIFKPTKAGTYVLYVQIKDAAGKTSIKSIDNYVVVNNPLVKSFTSDKPKGQYINSDVKLTVVGTGGTIPYQYKFYYKLGAITTTIQNFSTTNTAVFKSSIAGKYTLYVDIKDANGKISTGKISNYKVMKYPNVKTFKTDMITGQNINTNIQLTAKGADGVVPYVYKFYYKLGTNTVVIQDFSTTNTTTFKPTIAGTYTLFVDLKDVNGQIGTKSLSNFVVVDKPIIQKFTTSKESGQYIKTSIGLSSEITGGKTPYQYKYYYKLGTTTVIIKNYSTTNVATFIPTKPGKYNLYVDVKDASGKISTRKISNYQVYDSLSVKRFSADKVSGQVINTSIKLSSIGAGGKEPYQYRFYYKLGTSTKIIQEYSISNTTTFKPTSSGTYILYVSIKDAGGKISTMSIPDYVVTK